ncbi:MAG: hypothetical protein P1U67_03375 [Alcanivoracaceae bacterium]|nr:hypothetical protein [Alcanivoracaceae bacterium]
MTATTLYVAFPASDELYARTMKFINAVEANPEVSQQALLSDIPSKFIDEVLAAFFEGPVDAAGLKGGSAGVIHSLMGMVGSASRALASKVLGKVTIAEQRVLAAHFREITHEKDGKYYCGFALDPEVANEAVLMFDSFRSGNGERDQLVRIMTAIGDGTVQNFFDVPMMTVKVGMVTRGLVSAGRATIEKASHSMNRKILPDMEPTARQRVLEYMAGMLQEF